MQNHLSSGRTQALPHQAVKSDNRRGQSKSSHQAVSRPAAVWWVFVVLVAIAFTLPARGQDPNPDPKYPMSTNASLGATVSFRLVASSTNHPLTFQWQHEGTNLPAATNATLVLTNLAVTNAGGYMAWITNAGGNFTNTRTAILTVDTTFTKITRGPLVEDLHPTDGLAWGDYDNDGLLDVLVLAGDFTSHHLLYRNLGGDNFVRITNAITTRVGNSWGAQWADVDNDGDVDLFILHPGDGGMVRNEIFRNDGSGVFSPMNTAATAIAAYHSDATWIDHNRDGWLDVFTTTGADQPRTDFFFQNRGDWRFEAWTTNEVGAVVAFKATAGPVWCDIDGDGDLDLYVSNIGGTTNFLYRNDGGQMIPVKAGSLPAKRSTWAATWGDFNNDGLFDLFTGGENGTNTLHLNRGNWVFEDVTVSSGLSLTGNVYLASAGDFDNDGDLDLYVSRWDATDVLYVNRGDGTFDQPNVGMLLTEPFRNGAVWVDYDNDGFLDLFQPCGSTNPERNRLYRNSLPEFGNANHWIKFRLKGTASNASAIGARVWVRATIGGKETWQVRQVTTGCLTASPTDGMRLHFGLGDATVVDLVRIEWPSGNVQELVNQTTDRIATVTEPTRINPVRPTASQGASITLTNAITGIAYQWLHNGTNLVGQTDRTLTLTDLVAADAGRYGVVVTLSNGSTQTNYAYLNIDTQFTQVTTGPVVLGGGHPNSGSWGDYDGDGYMDLFVAHQRIGGVGQNVLYHNNADGTFTSVTNGTFGTDWSFSFSDSNWGDFDNDGKLDLFVVNWPATPNGPFDNYLYRNVGGGSFEKVTTSQMFDGLPGGTPGAWMDINRDGFLDFFVCSSWTKDGGVVFNTPNALFTGHGDGSFTRMTEPPLGTDISDTQAAAWADIDNDGRMDLLVAALPHRLQYHQEPDGSFKRVNSVFTAGAGNPLRLACGDYNNDGNVDVFLAQGSEMPELYRGLGNGQFERKTMERAGSYSAFLNGSWGDYDNDGYLDLVTTDNSDSGPGACQLYRNNRDGTFTRTTTSTLVNQAAHSWGCSWADYDNDGFLDLFVANGYYLEGYKNFLFHNNTNGNHWLTLKLIGTTSNRSAIGARVKATARLWGKTVIQMRDVGGHASYNENDPRPHFGLGDATNVNTLRIEWPSGTVQDLRNVTADQILTVIEPRRPVLTVTITPTQVTGTLTGDTNQVYELQVSNDMDAGWTALTPVTTDASGKGNWTDAAVAPQGRRFYKAVKTP